MKIGFDISSQSLPRSGVGQYQINLLNALLKIDKENFYNLYAFNFRNRRRFDDIKFTHKEIKKLPPGVRREIKMFCYYDDEHVHIPRIGLNAANLSVYLNHSKTPNVKFKKNGELVSLRAIKKGEELLMDYDIEFNAVHVFK